MAEKQAHIAKLTAQIDELHQRCTQLKRSLGHSQVHEETDVAMLRKTHSQPEAALLQLRDAKASELQLLALRSCGHSTRNCFSNGARQPGDRFNLQILMAVADCMQAQQLQLKAHNERYEKLLHENRALRDLAKAPSSSSNGTSAQQASTQRPATAGVRAIAAARPAPGLDHKSNDARERAMRALAEMEDDNVSTVSTVASYRTMAATEAATALLATPTQQQQRQPSGQERSRHQQQQQQQARPPATAKPQAAAGHRPPPREAFAVENPKSPPAAHRAAPALSKRPAVDAAAAQRQHEQQQLRQQQHVAAQQAIRSANYGGGGTSGGGGEAELRLLTLKKRLDEAVAENAMWKRQFATRLEEKLAERLSALGQPSSVAVGSSAPKPRPAAAPAPASSVTAAASATAASAAGKDGAAKADAAKGGAVDAKALAAAKKETEAAEAAAKAAEVAAATARAEMAKAVEELRIWKEKAQASAKVEKAAKEKAEVAARDAAARVESASKDAAEKVAAATKRAEKAEKEGQAASKSAADRHEKELAGERAEASKREGALKEQLQATRREAARMSGELKKVTQGGSAELDAMRARLEDAEKRLGEADSHHEAEMAKREASAQHELALEKKAAKTAQDELQAKLDEAQRALREREAQLEDSRAGTRSATARADAGEASLLRANEQLAAERLRLSEVETEVREAHRRAANWKDERAALQAELHAERRHVELERKHKEALEHSLKNERSVNASIQVLLESRLGELASQQNATELAQGAEALQVLMGRAAASQAALEARELVLADAFALLTSRHSERLGSIERAAEQRERWGATAERIDGILAQGRLGSPEMSTGVQADEMRKLSEQLKRLQRDQSSGAATEALASQEAQLQQAIAKFTQRNNHLHEQLQNAHEQIAELQRLLGRKTPAGAAGAGAGASVPHRAPPKAPPATQAQREATKAALERYGSAEYNASAPHPPSQHPGRR